MSQKRVFVVLIILIILTISISIIIFFNNNITKNIFSDSKKIKDCVGSECEFDRGSIGEEETQIVESNNNIEENQNEPNNKIISENQENMESSSSTSSPATIDTIAGIKNGDGFYANLSIIKSPQGIGVGSDGSVYVAETTSTSIYNDIRKINTSGIITTIAGRGKRGFSGDGGPANKSLLNIPTHAVPDNFGNIYIADQSNHRIRKIDSNGIISTIAGTGVGGFNGDGPALQKNLYYPKSLAVDSSGDVYVAEPYSYIIRKIDVHSNPMTITTVAGNGRSGPSTNGILATNSKLSLPFSIWVDSSDNLYITETGVGKIIKVNSSGIISTVAGTGVGGFNGDGPATSRQLNSPTEIIGKSDGTIFFIDKGNSRVRKLSSGQLTTVAGTGVNGFNGDENIGIQTMINNPSGMGLMPNGDCLISDTDNNRLISLAGCDGNGLISNLAGRDNSFDTSFNGDGFNARVAIIQGTIGVARDSNGNTYLANAFSNTIRKIDSNGIITTIAGNGSKSFSGDGGPAISATLNGPRKVFIWNNEIYIADSYNRRIRKIDSNGIITTVIDVNSFFRPNSFISAFYIDESGNFYVTGTNNPLFKVDSNGNVVEQFGSFVFPTDIARDNFGNFYIAEVNTNSIYKITSNKAVIRIAGTGFGTNSIDGEGGNLLDDLGDNGPAIDATFKDPQGIDVSEDGSLIFIADQINRRIRLIDNGVIRTIGGNGYLTYSEDGEGGNLLDDLGDGGLLSSATFSDLQSSYLDNQGNLLVVDNSLNHDYFLVREIKGVLNNVNQNPPSASISSSPSSVAFQGSSTISWNSVYTTTCLISPGQYTGTSGSITVGPLITNTIYTLTCNGLDGSQIQRQTTVSVGSAPSNTYSLLGNINYYSNGNAVPNIEVKLQNISGQIIQTTMTNSDGNYSFSNVIEGSYKIIPSKALSGNDKRSISSLDAARILQRVVGLITFTDKQDVICDTTGNGGISALDAAKILQKIVDLINRVPVAENCNSDFVFFPEPTSGGIANPISRTSALCTPSSISLNSLSSNVVGINFKTGIFGDCTGNWAP